MAESAPRSQTTSSTRGNGASTEVDWESLIPVAVDSEDSMSPVNVQACWNKLYNLAGLRAPSEDVQRAFRLAVYVYGVINGTSREGSYSGKIVMSNGHTFEAAIIPQAVGKMQIRRFYRGNMIESYEALKKSRVIERDQRFVMKVSDYGISAADAFACADWFSNCPLFTPSERQAHAASFQFSLSRSRRNRNGRNLEDVENERLGANLDAQGIMDAPVRSEGRVSF